MSVATMTNEESRQFAYEEGYGQLAHREYVETMGGKWTRATWLHLQPKERGAWMAAAAKVKSVLAAELSP